MRPQCRRRELIYVASHGGYGIVCRNCGELYGGSSDLDMKYLAALNRNSRIVERELAKKERHVTGGTASAQRRAAPRCPRRRSASR